MRKCDFCVASLSNGKCYYAYNTQIIREPYCKKAIIVMSNTLKIQKRKKEKVKDEDWR